MKKISFSLDPREIERAAKELRDYAASLSVRAMELDRKLSEEAANEARAHYSGAVTVEPTDRGVMAYGQEVVFEEFGAGARISDPFPGGADVSFEIRRGAYSDLHNGEYAKSGYEAWHHNGERYEYVTPRNGLFYGMEQARSMAADIAEEVFGND